ncbi:MAG: D-glyceraldehyde dehydrogenase [Thermoplasmataceae archaeon]|jgi:D-glyceraldehyde dehydrogenase (NADP+)
MQLLIDGEWKDSSDGAKLEKISPVTGKKYGDFPAATKDDLKAAIDAAYDAFPKWSALTSKERSKFLYRAYSLIEKDRKELEDLLYKENGKVKIETRQETDGVLDQIQYYAEFARKITGDIVEGDTPENKIFQYKVPAGVVAALTPWNFPAAMVVRKLSPALLTGNTVVMKPSSDTPFTAYWLVKKFVEAGLPKGVLNFITGKGSVIGDDLVSHRKVAVVTMTGSTETGQRIMEKSSANMAKLILELGGKAPFMVWKDADLEAAARTFIWAKYWNTGQSCIAAERLYVHQDVYDRFLKMIISATGKLKVGDPMTSDMGPLINKGALQTTEKFVQDATSGGAKTLAGGKKPELSGELSGGYFFQPTIIGDVTQDSELFQKEVFGPVIGAMKVSSEDQMFELANDSRYGLASYLFTNDNALVMKASEAIRFGELYVNMPGPESSQGYHTGFRLTGQAGEGSKYGIEEYLKLKNVYIRYSREKLKVESVREDIFS